MLPSKKKTESAAGIKKSQDDLSLDPDTLAQVRDGWTN